MKVYPDLRDWWIGYYRGDTHHYVCPVPTLVLRWTRRRKVGRPPTDRPNQRRPFHMTTTEPTLTTWTQANAIIRRHFELYAKLPTFPAEAADELTDALASLLGFRDERQPVQLPAALDDNSHAFCDDPKCDHEL